MPVKHVPQDQFVIGSLVKMISTLSDQAEEGRVYNTAIGFGIDEAVRNNMRRLMQRRTPMVGWNDLLDDAIHESAEQVQHELSLHGLRFDLGQYLDNARGSLASAAKEMLGLNRKLIESRERKRIAEKTPVATAGSRRHYEISELGLLDSVEGILATPTDDVSSLNVEKIQEAFTTVGDWFPFEVNVDGLVFIVDDDGAIFVSTENYPKEALERAKAGLHRLAEILYS